MAETPNKDPLHGVTLETIVKTLAEVLGWEQLGQLIRIRCFQYDPSVSSSLKFLRRTPWARTEVERLYIERIVKGR
ncbi:MAG TPA: VF530 family protein [Polyangiaceae bacterium]|nr:VF530 family protein [Polyangiaceae bacterium]